MLTTLSLSPWDVALVTTPCSLKALIALVVSCFRTRSSHERQTDRDKQRERERERVSECQVGPPPPVTVNLSVRFHTHLALLPFELIRRTPGRLLQLSLLRLGDLAVPARRLHLALGLLAALEQVLLRHDWTQNWMMESIRARPTLALPRPLRDKRSIGQRPSQPMSPRASPVSSARRLVGAPLQRPRLH